MLTNKLIEDVKSFSIENSIQEYISNKSYFTPALYSKLVLEEAFGLRRGNKLFDKALLIMAGKVAQFTKKANESKKFKKFNSRTYEVVKK